MVSRTDADQTIKLELTIDRADLERQLGQTFQGPVAAGGTGGPAARRRPTRVEPGAQMGKMLGKLAGLTGIAYTLTSILKTSQVMSTTASAFNSIIGALVDSFLAPLLPLLIPVMRKLASYILPAAKTGQEVADTVERARRGEITFGKETPERGLIKKVMEAQYALNPVTAPLYWGRQMRNRRDEEGMTAGGGGGAPPGTVVVNINGTTYDQIIREIQDRVGEAFRDMASKSYMGR